MSCEGEGFSDGQPEGSNRHQERPCGGARRLGRCTSTPRGDGGGAQNHTEGLYRRERQAAETRWNFAAKHQKLDAFKEKLQFQGDLRKQLLSKVQTQRKSLILEIEEERQAQLIAAEERLHDVEKLKASHAEQLAQLEASSQSALADLQAASQRRAEQLAQLEASSRTALTDLQAASQRRMGEARSAFASKVDELLALLREDLDDARADAQLAGGVLTGGAHPAVERMKARQAAAAKAAAEATGEAAAAPRGSTAIVPSEVAGGQKAAVAAIEADAAAAAAAFAKIDKDGWSHHAHRGHPGGQAGQRPAHDARTASGNQAGGRLA